MSDEDIMIHVADQMYECDWFSEETMMTWKDMQDTDKMWAKCQAFFEATYVGRKCYNDAKGQTKKSMNVFTEADLVMYLEVIEMKTMQENMEWDEHIQQVMEQNATLMNLVQD